MSPEPADVYEFGPFRLEPAERLLSRSGRPLGLTPKAFDTLQALVINEGRAISKEDLMTRVWPDAHVTEGTLAQNIFAIRKALGDADSVETVPKFGYRFRLPVRVLRGASPKVLLVVLPFDNLSGDAEEEYFSDGLTDEMIAQLGRLNPQRLGVIARTSAMKYKHAKTSIDRIGRELGVSYVLEGSVRRSANRVRVTAQLIQVSDQTHVWSETYDRPVGDMLTLQGEVAQAIAVEIRVRFTPQEQVRLATARPVDADAYEAYLRGRYFWNRRSREALAKSAAYFSKALTIEPRYAAAYAGLADVYLTQLDYNYLAPQQAFALVTPVVMQALRLDDTLAEPHTTLGHLRLHEFKWADAGDQFARAIALNPGYGAAHYYYGNWLAALGRWDEAFAEAQHALALDPMSPNARQNRMFMFYLARRYDEALAQALETIEIDPSYVAIHYYVGLIYERLGRYDDAVASFAKVRGRAANRGTTVLTALGRVYALAGRHDEARRVLKDLEDVSGREYVSTYDLALLLLALGDRDRAFALLSEAYDHRSSFLPFINVDARLDGVRSDPRLTELVQRMDFPATAR